VSAPKRIQLRRTKGWRKPAGTVVVARPTKWGNPYRADDYIEHYPDSEAPERRRMAVSDFRGLVDGRWPDDQPYPTDDIAELRGCDLACWCPLVDEHGQHVPCHADVLLELANAPVAASATVGCPADTRGDR
jgi:hypothetical protein